MIVLDRISFLLLNFTLLINTKFLEYRIYYLPVPVKQTVSTDSEIARNLRLLITTFNTNLKKYLGIREVKIILCKSKEKSGDCNFICKKYFGDKYKSHIKTFYENS